MIFRELLKTFLNDDRGSTMTEFVIGLPIFLLIFSGFGSLYQLGEGRLLTIATSNAELWDNAQNNPPASSLSPLGAAGDLFNGGFGNGAIVAAESGGTYTESAAKTAFASFIPGSDVDPKISIAEITELDGSSPSNSLLDDQPADVTNTEFNSITQAINSVVDLTGVRLSVGAGIRYGKEKSTATDTTITTAFGDFTSKGVELEVPRNTVAVHRLIPVGLTRLAVGGDESLNRSILEFKTEEPNTDGKPDWADENAGPITDPSKEVENCSESDARRSGRQVENCKAAALPESGGPYTPAQIQAANEQCEKEAKCK